MPPEDLKLSVFRIDGLHADLIWNLGSSLRKKRTLHGRADILYRDVSEIEPLLAIAEPPPPLHANIVGWPSEKSERLLLAADLASIASPFLKPN